MLRLRFLVDRVVSLSWLVPVSLVAAGCSGAPPDSAVTAPNPPSVAPTPAAGVVDLALTRGIESDVSLRASPEATCWLRDEAGEGDATKGVRLVADDLGDVSFRFRPRAEATSASMRLECEGRGGARTTRRLLVRSVATEAEATPAPVSRLDARRVRRALTDDPASSSDADLVARGFPPRPDREQSPEAYEHWRAIVSRDAFAIPAPTRPHYGEAHPAVLGRTGPARLFTGPVDTSNWSGVAQTRSYERSTVVPGYAMVGAPFERVSADWTVPSVTGDPPDDTSAWSWIGLGGWWYADNRPPVFGYTPRIFYERGAANTALIQAGTAQSTTLFLFGWVTTYRVWAEFWTNNGQPDSLSQTLALPIKPGDRIDANVWSCDANRVATAKGAYGCYYILNETSGAFVEGKIAQPSNTIGFFGESAEWVVESPTTSNGLYDLANFGAMTMNDTWTLDASNATGSALGGRPLTMKDGDAVLARGGFGDPAIQQVTQTWQAFR